MSAKDACPVACGTCPTCEDDTKFFVGFKTKDKYKGCYWVGEDRDERCGLTGRIKKETGILAYHACPIQCHMCPFECEDNPLWYKKKGPDKDGCASIPADVDDKNHQKMCNTKGKVEGGDKKLRPYGYDYLGCPLTCGDCPEAWPTPIPTMVHFRLLWHSADRSDTCKR